MFKGAFPASIFYMIGGSCAILSIVVIYWQSQYYHQEPPFPHQWISKVAQHYPEFVVFRTTTISGAVLIILGWMTNHFFLQTFCREHGINLKKYYAQIPLILGIIGGLLLMGNTATIDTGLMNQKLHQFCASKFFIVTLLGQIYNTVICTDLYLKTKAISQKNLFLKYVMMFLLILQIIDSSIKGEGPLFEEARGDYSSDKGKFLEWTLTATVISNFISIGLDVWKFEFVYEQVQVEEGTQLREAIM